jgi:hypothetical protein
VDKLERKTVCLELTGDNFTAINIIITYEIQVL